MATTRKAKVILPKGGSLVPLFTIDGETNNLIINRDFVKGIEPFKTIYEKDRTFEKHRAYRILMVIYLMFDINSELAGLEEVEMQTKALRLATIDKEEIGQADWDRVLASKETYEMLYENLNPQIKIHRRLKNGLNLADKVLELQIKNLQNTLDSIGTAKADGSVVGITELVTALNTLLTLSGSIPKAIKDIDDVFNSIRSQTKDDVIVWGDKALEDRENPDYILKKYGTTSAES